MENEKMFSVIIPIYNAEKTIERTLASLISNREWIHEIILVNDHCTDKTFEKIEPFKYWFPMTVIENTGKHNASMARKVGMLHATGEWITFLDADDCFVGTCFRYVRWKILDEIENGNDPLVIYPLRISCLMGFFDMDLIEFFPHSCVGCFYKLDYLLEHNLLPDEDLPLAEDEYLGKKIQMTIAGVEKKEESLVSYLYPTYLIHHDEMRESLATGNWLNYTLRYHLYLYEKLTDEFVQYDYMYEDLKKLYIENFFLAYFLYLLMDENEMFTKEELASQLKYFYHYLWFGAEKLYITEDEIKQYFLTHREDIEGLMNAAMRTLFVDPIEDKEYAVADFLKLIHEHEEDILDSDPRP